MVKENKKDAKKFHKSSKGKKQNLNVSMEVPELQINSNPKNDENKIEKNVEKNVESESPKILFNCTPCDKPFDSDLSLEMHIKSVHYVARLECPKCLELFSTKESFLSHACKLKSHEEPKLEKQEKPKVEKKCPICFQMISMDIMKEHIGTEHLGLSGMNFKQTQTKVDQSSILGEF